MQPGIIVLLFICLLNFTVKAQFTITGKVIENKSRLPISGASVFLNNATKGTMTNEEGKFSLTNIADGEYDIIVSSIGYQTYTININVSIQPGPVLIELNVKPVSLKEINIYPPDVRNRYMELFKKNFLGMSENATSCKILNPGIINFKYDKSKDLLEASTGEFLLIDNKALGYRLKFLLDRFSLSEVSSFSSTVYFEGPVLFELMGGKNLKKKYWLKNRQYSYEGSTMHFFRSACSRTINAEGFVMHKIIRKPNTDRPPDDLIQSKILYYSTVKATASVRDSLQLWQKRSAMPKIIQYLLTDTLKDNDIIKPTDTQGIHALKFEDFLYVAYSGKKNTRLSSFYPTVNSPPYSIISLHEDYAFFDNNGIVTNPGSIIFEGYWSTTGKVADMLPSDYIPGK